MTRNTTVARKAEELLSIPVVATSPVAGGDISTATRLKLSDGRSVLMKTHTNPPADFFAAEARGLRWLAEVGDDGVRVPEVLGVDAECLVIPWIEPGKQTPDAALDFGRRLAATHASAPDGFGGASDGFIGRLPMRNTPKASWPEFYATQRVLPYLKLARDRDAISAEDTSVVEGIIGKLTTLLPEEPAARLHGDLWNGNVLWGSDGACHVIDPAAYGGHREVDIAMLALFGMPHLQRALEAYDEAAPLADGWEDRLGIHQLFPLLVHACMFGGGYGARAAAVAGRY
ncbi:fructosamine kinase family protein [Nocardioides sp. AE5]|uniref:fructosamine kinase family protein n=1 Tax=Nocardioides sp. AE5 TaxID=2962573 RepID=UPI0028820CCD|nr:fructosamine kinase family protein [Nocardioides sp. AE5]MDT0203409.1 fructosamine kinase family protein [Nocardioides sp. AE5]